MTAVTKDLATPRTEGALLSLLMAASTVMYAGTLACLNGSGYAIDGADSSGNRFVGVVEEGKDNSTGSAGDLSVIVRRHGTFQLATNWSAAITDRGKKVYLVDNATVGLLSSSLGTAIYVGTIEEIESTSVVWVKVESLPTLPDEARADKVYQVQIVGVNATTFDFSAEAAKYGGSNFSIPSLAAVQSVVSFVTATGALNRLKVATTHYTVASGNLSAVGDETANTWVITFLGKLLP